MSVFAKKLLSQESGYSGDKPNQRGKYVLVSQANLRFFPFLSSTTLNDAKVINIFLDSGRNIGVNVVYHNAKYFPQSHDRAHNEVRIYRNTILDADLNLDRGVILVMIKTEKTGSYRAFSVQTEDPLFQDWEGVVKRIQTGGPIELNEFPFSDARLSRPSQSLEEQMDNQLEVVQDAIDRYSRQRRQQTGLEDDPGKILEFVINSQQAYADWIRQIYQFKCAVRGVSLVDSSHVGLDACHIMGHAEGGPLLPTNGILMSKDIHACFDRGLISLDTENRIIVSSRINSSSELYKYNRVKIEPIAQYRMFAPFSGYVEHHRTTRFEQ